MMLVLDSFLDKDHSSLPAYIKAGKEFGISDTSNETIISNSDDFISYEHSIDLYQACGSKDKTIKIVPGEHNTSRPNDVKASALVFAAKHLGRVLDIKSVGSDVESGILHFAGLTDLRIHIDEGADEWEATE